MKRPWSGSSAGVFEEKSEGIRIAEGVEGIRGPGPGVGLAEGHSEDMDFQPFILSEGAPGRLLGRGAV